MRCEIYHSITTKIILLLIIYLLFGGFQIVYAQGTLSNILVLPSNTMMQPGQIKTFTIAGIDSQGNDVPLVDPKVQGTGGTLKINRDPVTFELYVTFTAGQQTGSFYFEVWDASASGEPGTSGAIWGSGSITISNASSELSDIDIFPETDSAKVAEQIEFNAKGKNQYDIDYDINDPEWSTSGGGDINPDGPSCIYIATETGGYTITCRQRGTNIQGTANIIVYESSDLTEIEVFLETDSMKVAEQQEITAKGKDQYGDDYTITNPVWTNTGTGILNPNGSTCTYTANETGKDTIKCRQEGTNIEGSAEITVMQGSPDEFNAEWDPEYGVLTVRAKEGDNIHIGRGDDGEVLVNGFSVKDENGENLGADRVKKIHVHGNERNNVVDLREVTDENFPNIPQGGPGEMSTLTFCEGGNDKVYGSDKSDYMQGDDGNDILYGGAGHDELLGGKDNDHLYAGSGNNSLYGDKGNDVLYGNTYKDTRDGGEGDDRFESNPPPGTVPANQIFRQVITQRAVYTGLSNVPAVEATIDTLIDSVGNDTISFAFDTQSITLDIDQQNYAQNVNANNRFIVLIGQFENIIGGPEDDVFHVDPLDVERFVDGGSESGDRIIVETMGLTPSDDGSKITIPGYEPIKYKNCTIVEYENLVSVEEETSKGIPNEFMLYQNYPNPFNPTTTIEYKVKEGCNVELIIYDLLGREVIKLADDNHFPGKYRFVFDTRGLVSGIYFYKIIMKDSESSTKIIYEETKKMALIK